MGTPDFAVPALTMLAAADSGQDVVLVVTKPDKPAKRGKKITSSPVKIKADELGIPTSQPEKINGNSEFFEMITDLAPDLIVVCAYGKILPSDILDIPPFGCINIHASILPEFRGAAPIHRAVLEGVKETGVTLMYMSDGIDEGDMIAFSKTPVGSKNTGELHDELAVLGAELLKANLSCIADGDIVRIAQNSEKVSYAPMIDKKDGHLDFRKKADELERLVRAMTPTPGAFAFVDELKMKVVKAHTGTSQKNEPPGTVINTGDNGIEVKAGGDTSLIITDLQMPGKRVMDAGSFLRGNKLEEGRLLR